MAKTTDYNASHPPVRPGERTGQVWKGRDHDIRSDEDDGVTMGLAFVRFAAGASFDFAWPYDEVSVVTKGSLTVRTQGELLTAYEGEILTQPKGVPARFEIAEDMEMICVHYPTFARAFGVSVHEHTALAERGVTIEEPTVEPRGSEYAGGLFNPTIMQVFNIADMSQWIDVDTEQGAWVSYIADYTEGFPVGLAFSDFKAGGVHDLQFPYDEVAAITQGSFILRSQGREFTVEAGQMLYMPQNVSAVFDIREDTVTVGVHHPTFEETMGEPPRPE